MEVNKYLLLLRHHFARHFVFIARRELTFLVCGNVHHRLCRFVLVATSFVVVLVRFILFWLSLYLNRPSIIRFDYLIDQVLVRNVQYDIYIVFSFVCYILCGLSCITIIFKSTMFSMHALFRFSQPLTFKPTTQVWRMIYQLTIENEADFYYSNRKAIAELKQQIILSRTLRHPIDSMAFMVNIFKSIYFKACLPGLTMDKPLRPIQFNKRLPYLAHFPLTNEMRVRALMLMFFAEAYSMLLKTLTIIIYSLIIFLTIDWPSLTWTETIFVHCDLILQTITAWSFIKVVVILVLIVMLSFNLYSSIYSQLNLGLQAVHRQLRSTEPMSQPRLACYFTYFRHTHLGLVLQMVKDNQQFWSEISLTLLSTNIPMMVYIFSYFIYKDVTHWVEVFLLSVALFFYTTLVLPYFIALALISDRLHQPANHLPLLQQTFEGDDRHQPSRARFLRIKLALMQYHELLHVEASSGRRVGFTTGWSDVITRYFLFRFFFLNFSYLLFAVDFFVRSFGLQNKTVTSV